MRKSRLYLYYIILAVICQGVGVLAWGGIVVAEEGDEATSATITETQKEAIRKNCDMIRENLKYTQREDSRTRVYLGRYYETILTKFVTPLNLRLVENNISDAGLITNQSDLATRRGMFVNDFIGYSQELEELTQIDCKTEPEKFYTQLVEVREKRAAVQKDAKKMRGLIDDQVKLVTELKGRV